MSNPPYAVVDPSSGEEVETFPFATDAEVDQAVAQAHAAHADWAGLTIEQRGEVVKRVAELFEERKHDLSEIARTEMGKALDQGIDETELCRDIFAYFAEHGPALAADQPIPTGDGAKAFVRRRSIGVLLGIMPWNFPFYQVARFVAPNLMLGNTIVLKHAESVPRSALAVEQLLHDAGVPRAVYTNLFATHDQVATIIADPRVQGVSLTGSERAGSAVAALAGQHLKKCVLELGGSDPMIVLDTDDLDSLVGDAWDFRVYNAGQACNANKRMIVRSEVFGDFVDALVERARSVEDFAPLSSRAAAETLHAQVQEAVAAGATLHVGGELADDASARYSPAVLTGVTPDMRAYREELFGPVAVVYEVTSDDEAVSLANDTPYGLGGSVFSTDVGRARAVADRLDVGMANVNTVAGEAAELPFGGVKRSGFGRELGPLGMDEFVNKQLLYVAD